MFIERIRHIFTLAFIPKRWRLSLFISWGALAGLGMLVIYISNAASYLNDKPETCINCHIMAPWYATWERSSHGHGATICNDCHVPHSNIFSKYLFKAEDGSRHTAIFTLGIEPQVIRIRKGAYSVVQNNCIRCHWQAHQELFLSSLMSSDIETDKRYCWDCHREIPHGRGNSLASVPYARVPTLERIAPKWLEPFLNGERSE